MSSLAAISILHAHGSRSGSSDHQSNAQVCSSTEKPEISVANSGRKPTSWILPITSSAERNRDGSSLRHPFKFQSLSIVCYLLPAGTGVKHSQQRVSGSFSSHAHIILYIKLTGNIFTVFILRIPWDTGIWDMASVSFYRDHVDHVDKVTENQGLQGTYYKALYEI